MEKNIKRGLFSLLCVLVTFSIAVFVIPFNKNGVFVIAYAFGVVAIVLQLYFFKVSFKDKTLAKSKIYGFPIARIGVVYLIGQLAVSLVQMVLTAVLPIWVAMIINVVILMAALLGCVAAETMRDEIERQDEVLKKNVSNMRELQSLTASLPEMCKNPEIKTELQKLADEFRYSDPVSSERTEVLEKELGYNVCEIQKAIIAGDENAGEGFITKAKNLLVERNRVCKVSK